MYHIIALNGKLRFLSKRPSWDVDKGGDTWGGPCCPGEAGGGVALRFPVGVAGAQEPLPAPAWALGPERLVPSPELGSPGWGGGDNSRRALSLPLPLGEPALSFLPAVLLPVLAFFRATPQSAGEKARGKPATGCAWRRDVEGSVPFHFFFPFHSAGAWCLERKKHLRSACEAPAGPRGRGGPAAAGARAAGGGARGARWVGACARALFLLQTWAPPGTEVRSGHVCVSPGVACLARSTGRWGGVPAPLLGRR